MWRRKYGAYSDRQRRQARLETPSQGGSAGSNPGRGYKNRAVTTRAIVADPSTPLSMRLGEVPTPTPLPNQALIRVEHVSLNHGDLNDARSGRVPAGSVLGSDASGIVVEPAADGSGPGVGARVVALAEGAFAEVAAVRTGSLAEVPPGVDLDVAAALPVAGLAAFRAIRGCGSLLGKRILITGASGGVGTFAVQLA